MKNTSVVMLAFTLFSSLSLSAASAGMGVFAMTPVSVPDNASSIALLGLSFVALVALRKKLRR